jgi:Cu/Ag efflux protein CusF
MRKWIALFFVAAILLSPQTFLSVSEAQSSVRARGVIRNVDLEAGTVTLAISRDGDLLRLQTDDQTVIIRNGERATLRDLQQGDTAVALYNPSTHLASRIEARGDAADEVTRVEGVIAALDLDAHTLTIAPSNDGPLVTLNVTNNTAISLDGNPARLHELERGFPVAAAFVRRTLEALRIQAESHVEIRGIIRDVGVVNHTLTIAPSNGGPDVTLLVRPDTPISLNDRPATLEDLRRGFHVVAAYNPHTLVAARIAATSLGEVVGHIRSVDPSTATVVIAPLVGDGPVELQVIHSTVITIGGEPASLDQLRPGMGAHAVYNIVSFVAVRIDARPLDDDRCTELRVAGSISSIDLEASTVTISPAPGQTPLTLKVVERTEITINGRPARLSDLRVGMRVFARFCRENLVAVNIAVRARAE